MANKDVYNYTVKIGSDGSSEMYNEAGRLNYPENSISYLLVGVLSCMANTAVAMLEKMKIEYEKVVLSGKLYMVDEKIRYGNRIECEMSLEGGPELADDVKERLAQLTKKYCTVSVTISSNPEITLSMK